MLEPWQQLDFQSTQWDGDLDMGKRYTQEQVMKAARSAAIAMADAPLSRILPSNIASTCANTAKNECVAAILDRTQTPPHIGRRTKINRTFYA